MSVRPGYKQTEVGVIPDEWEVVFLGDIFKFKNGLNKGKEYFGHGTPIVNYMDVYAKAGLYGLEINGRVEVNKTELKAYDVRRGDVFFTRTSETVEEVGISSVMLDDIADTVFSGFILRARPQNASLTNQYKKYCFLSPDIRRQIVSTSSYTTRALTNGRLLSAILIARPSIAEQDAIAAALSDVDELLAKLDQLIAKKRDLKQGAMQQLLTGQTRLPGFSGEWKVKQLGDCIEKFIGGGTPSRTVPQYWGDEIPWVTVKDFATFNPRHAQESITKKGLRNSASHLIAKGTLITSTRMALGKAVIYDVDVAINQDLKALFPKPELETKYLYFWFQYYGQMIDELGSGSTVKGISLPDLKKLEFQLPDVKEQKEVASVLLDMDAELATLETRRGKTRELKQGMMQELLTGRIRLI